MIVCVCHRISDRDIAAHVDAGCASFDDLQIDTGVSTRCGTCLSSAQDTFERCRHACGGCGGGAHGGTGVISAVAWS